MLPMPRLVCQEPGVPDKSSRGLGSMSRYSAQILICFIAYIFQFFYSSVGLVGNFAGLPVCTLPSAIVHRNQNEAGHQTIKYPSMPCWGAAGPSKHSDNMGENCINGTFSVQEPSEWRVFWVWEYFPSYLASKTWNMKIECCFRPKWFFLSFLFSFLFSFCLPVCL